MYGGSFAPRWRRSSLADGAAFPSFTTTYADNFCCSPSPVTWTTASCRVECEASTDSISPNSMRKPRSLTWLSTRPRYSISPWERNRPKSPVRYNLGDWFVTTRFGTKRSAVNSGRCR